MSYRYFLKADWQDGWDEVSKGEFIAAERVAGFYPKCASTDQKYMDTCATGGFGCGGVSGKIEHNGAY